MKDFLGNKLQVDDVVVYLQGHYKEFYIGNIVNFTKCNVVIKSRSNSEQLLYVHPLRTIKVDNK